ncbi:hypothetical protein EXIGLDRAFT_755010 [Exidia glandulosa HHB12029]|uniref:Uncharacterized protein n=1 Tax=Exidia glandulosa HHB12029 TaxID=1314781 RepID=A0A165CER6_EXIGL|nr:hypothetical protein EXIGLDRAFT_755010 [Exidia glandulosa HHB12029]
MSALPKGNLDPEVELPAPTQNVPDEAETLPPPSPHAPSYEENDPTRPATPPPSYPTAGAKRPLPDTPSFGAEAEERFVARSLDNERAHRRSSRLAARVSNASTTSALSASLAQAGSSAAGAGITAGPSAPPASASNAPVTLDSPLSTNPPSDEDESEPEPDSRDKGKGRADQVARSDEPEAQPEPQGKGKGRADQPPTVRPTAKERAADIVAQYHGLAAGPNRDLGEYVRPTRAHQTPRVSVPIRVSDSGKCLVAVEPDEDFVPSPTDAFAPKPKPAQPPPKGDSSRPHPAPTTTASTRTSQTADSIERDRHHAEAAAIAYEAGAPPSTRPFDDDNDKPEDFMDYEMDLAPNSPTVEHVERRRTRSIARSMNTPSPPAEAYHPVRSPLPPSSFGAYSSSEEDGPEVFDPAAMAPPSDSEDEWENVRQPDTAQPAQARGRRRGGLALPPPMVLSDSERRRMVRMHPSLEKATITFFGSGAREIDGMPRNFIWQNVAESQRKLFRKQKYSIILRYHVAEGELVPAEAAVADFIPPLLGRLWPVQYAAGTHRVYAVGLQRADNAAGYPARLSFILADNEDYVHDTLKPHRAITIGKHGFFVYRIKERKSSDHMYILARLPKHPDVIPWLHQALVDAWRQSSAVQELARYAGVLPEGMDHIDVMEQSLTIRELEVTHRRTNVPKKQLSVHVTPLNHSPDAYLAQRAALSAIKVTDPRFGTAMAETEEWDCLDCDGITHPAGVCFAEKLENWPPGANVHRGPTPSTSSTSNPSTNPSSSSQPAPNIRIPAPRQPAPADRTQRSQPPAQGSARPNQNARGRSARRGAWEGPSRGTRGRGRGGF